MIGLAQSVRICQGGKIFLNADSKVDFQDREYSIVPHGGRGHPERIPLLDERSGTIAGQRHDLNRPIEDPRTRGEIENALKNIKFNVKYTIPVDDAKRRRMFICLAL